MKAGRHAVERHFNKGMTAAQPVADAGTTPPIKGFGSGRRFG